MVFRIPVALVVATLLLPTVWAQSSVQNLLDPGDKESVSKPPQVPSEVIAEIRKRAEQTYPDNFSTQLFTIKNESKAWQSLQTHSRSREGV